MNTKNHPAGSADTPELTSAPITMSLMNKSQFAQKLGVSVRTVENLVKSGELPPGVRIGRFVYWTLQVVEAWERRLFAAQMNAMR